jgi:hypothetical protein
VRASPASNITPPNLASLRSACIELRDYLDRIRRSIDEEIRSYPTPIPRCDAQFNYLYEQRSRLSQALERANAALAGAPSSVQLTDAIRHFISAAAYSDGAEEESLKRRLRDEL